jgi:hypothetical protein
VVALTGIVAALLLAGGSTCKPASPPVQRTGGVTVAGQVISKDGRPQGGLRVIFACRTGPKDADRIDGFSDWSTDDGRFSVSAVPAGDCSFSLVEPWGFCGPQDVVEVAIRDGVDVRGLALRARGPCGKHPPWVVGQVTDESGHGLVGYFVYTACGDKCSTTQEDCTFSAPVPVDSNGNFELFGREAGPCRIRAYARGSEADSPAAACDEKDCADVSVRAEGPTVEVKFVVAPTVTGQPEPDQQTGPEE